MITHVIAVAYVNLDIHIIFLIHLLFVQVEADMRREMERKEQERKKNQKLDFASGGIQPGNVVPTPKISMPTAGT